MTPFALRALDRGLTAVLVSMLRLAEEELAMNVGAGRIEKCRPVADRVIEEVAARAEQVSGEKRVGDLVRQMAKLRLDEWLAAARNRAGGRNLGYLADRSGVTAALLRKPEEGDWRIFTCLNSLRDVEPTVGLVLVDKPGESGGPAPPGVTA